MRIARWVIVWCIVLAGGTLRLYYADTMKTDWDEDDYLVPAGMFRRLMDDGEWAEMVQVQQNFEHPLLVKLLYAVSIESDELAEVPTENVRYDNRIPLPPHTLRNTRLLSVLSGTLTLLVVAAISPLAGLALAVQSIHVHYSSVAYLDALPTLFTALAVTLYARRRHPWLAAACLGIAVAGKYPYAVVGGVIVLHALIVRRWPVTRLLAWGLVAVGVFFLLNPYLWPDPVGRVRDQLQYHEDYTQRSVVNHDPVKPLRQMVTPNKHFQHLFDDSEPYWFFAWTDWLLFVLAVPGTLLLLRRGSVYGWWLVLGFAFLIVWPTQWVQHDMVIVVPYSLAASAGLAGIVARVRR
jgi:hypothetical protein